MGQMQGEKCSAGRGHRFGDMRMGNGTQLREGEAAGPYHICITGGCLRLLSGKNLECIAVPYGVLMACLHCSPRTSSGWRLGRGELGRALHVEAGH